MKQTHSLMLVAILAAASCGGPGDFPQSPFPVSSAPQVRRLSVHDYVWTIGRLLGIDVSPFRFLEDSLDTGFDNAPASLDVQLEQADDYELMAWEIADAAVRDHRDRLMGSCAPETDGAAACKQAFFDRFVVRALRRPPTDSERARYSTLFDQTAEAGGFDEALTATTAAILESPGFLYRTEMGDGQRLDAYEVASQLAFLLTGGPPDDELLAAAGAGTLDAPSGLRAQAFRLTQTGESRLALRHLLDEWLGTWQLDFTYKDGAIYPAFDDPLHLAMRNELDRFYEYAVFDNPAGSLDQLLGSPVAFVNDRLASLYGIPPSSGDNMVEAGLDPDLRAGIFTRAGFLTVHAGVDSSNPIARGVFVRTALLCAPPPAPPPGIPRVPPGTTSAGTTRQRYEQHTADPFCQSCHAAIDGVGFGFEEFDGIGAFRTSENGQSIDDSGEVIGTVDADGPFVGTTELAARLRRSQTVTDCFVRQLFRAAMGRAEQDADEAFLRWQAARFDPDVPILDLAIRLATSPRVLAPEAAP